MFFWARESLIACRGDSVVFCLPRRSPRRGGAGPYCDSRAEPFKAEKSGFQEQVLDVSHLRFAGVPAFSRAARCMLGPSPAAGAGHRLLGPAGLRKFGATSARRLPRAPYPDVSMTDSGLRQRTQGRTRPRERTRFHREGALPLQPRQGSSPWTPQGSVALDPLVWDWP